MSERLYVVMHDKFMSGWGEARAKINLFVVECTTQEQATAIVKAAEERSEMRRIRMNYSCPKNSTGVHVSLRTFEELGGVWKAYHHEA